MIVDLMYKECLYTITLNNKYEGQFFLGPNKKKDLIEISGDDNNWIIKSRRNIKLLDTNENAIKSVKLKANEIYKLQIDEDIAFIFCHSLSGSNNSFYKYQVLENKEITIGRGENNTICFSKNYISTSHATLTYHNKYWSIVDNNSTNGTFVNDKKIEKESIDFGDVIYIMGLKIIVGYDFIVINNPDKCITLTDKDLVPLEREEVLELNNESDEIELKETEYFYRSPRFKQDIKCPNFKVDSPPNNGTKEKTPMLISLGPSFTMGIASLVTAFFSINNAIENKNISSAIPTIVMAVSMFIGSIIYPIIIRIYEKIRTNKSNKIRKDKYLKYLESIENNINDEIKKQETIFKATYVSIDECEDRILNKKRTLWERSYNQNDFLELRLGIGNLPLNCTIQYPERTFNLSEDELLDKMYELCEKPKLLKNVPILYSFYKNYITGIIGNKKLTKEYIKGLIFQIASLYGYDEVKTVFLYDENDNDFDFVKWLPHTFSDDKKIRYIATNNEEIKEVSYYLNNSLEARESLQENNKSNYLPYYVVFNLDKSLTLKADFINRLYQKNENINFSIINVFEELQELPKECSCVIEVLDDAVKIYDKTTTTEKISFKADINLTANPELLSKALANINLKSINNFQLPQVYNFMEMYKAGKLEHLNILKRWKENDPTKSLSVPIGIDNYGGVFNLDLHEKFHGPHGLVAGMTGSGKSEFIMTYILSLAINFHPSEVQFLLIDYKGGGMAKTFEELPHTSGIITNLDDSSMKRALVSINSELKRRQKIFVETSKKINISNLDIYKYQKLYREQKVSEPLSHLFIISDEFAELKTQKPEFMNELISAARIGRSLGIHLILATQKPSGIVDDQIWSNSKFRICLKVQEKNDSMDMLKRPDAALLKETGRFYLQVGYNELFEIGQSAWSGALYYPKEKTSLEFDNSIQVIDKNCRVLKDVAINKYEKVGQIANKQIDAIIKCIKSLSLNEKINIRPIWLPPLEDEILLPELINKYKISGVNKTQLAPLIGEYDDPKKQLKNYLRLDISNKGNTLVLGSVESGINAFINTMIYSLISEYTSEDINAYLLDFDTESLKAFEKAPHIGNVILANEKENIVNLIKMLYKEISSRKDRFSEYGGTFNNYIEESQETIPRILVVINNYAVYSELYNETEEDLIYLTREGTKYGIHFVVTANVINAVKYRLAQNFGQTIALNFNDDSIYNSIFSKTDGLIPKQVLGRGLIKLNNEFFEFQTAYITKNKNVYKYIKDYSKSLSGLKASKIAVLPDNIEPKMMVSYISSSLTIPIGMKKNDLDIAYFNINDNYISLGISEEKEYLPFISELSNFIQNNYVDYELMVIDPNNEINNLNPNIKHINNQNETLSIIDDLYNLVLERNNKYKEALEMGVHPEKYPEKIFIINSYADLIDNKDSISREKIELALEKGCADYNIHFIIFDKMKNISMTTVKRWYKTHINGNNGIWFGQNFRDQYLFNVDELNTNLKQELLGNEAMLITNSKAEIIRVISSKEEI